MKVKLTHLSNLPGAVGLPDEVIDVPRNIAARFIGQGGAVQVDGEPLKPAELANPAEVALPPLETGDDLPSDPSGGRRTVPRKKASR